MFTNGLDFIMNNTCLKRVLLATLSLFIFGSVSAVDYIVYKQHFEGSQNPTEAEHAVAYNALMKFQFPRCLDHLAELRAEELELLCSNEHHFLEAIIGQTYPNIKLLKVPTTLYELLMIKFNNRRFFGDPPKAENRGVITPGNFMNRDKAPEDHYLEAVRHGIKSFDLAFFDIETLPYSADGASKHEAFVNSLRQERSAELCFFHFKLNNEMLYYIAPMGFDSPERMVDECFTSIPGELVRSLSIRDIALLYPGCREIRDIRLKDTEFSKLITRAIAIEKYANENGFFVLYRGTNGSGAYLDSLGEFKRGIYRTDLSYGNSLFAGWHGDPGACAFWHIGLFEVHRGNTDERPQYKNYGYALLIPKKAYIEAFKQRDKLKMVFNISSYGTFESSFAFGENFHSSTVSAASFDREGLRQLEQNFQDALSNSAFELINRTQNTWESLISHRKNSSNAAETSESRKRKRSEMDSESDDEGAAKKKQELAVQ